MGAGLKGAIDDIKKHEGKGPFPSEADFAKKNPFTGKMKDGSPWSIKKDMKKADSYWADFGKN